MSKAMVIDDSRTIRLILSRTLSQLGYDVAQAANGREGLATLQDTGNGFDLILVDWNMPEMNGLELIRSLRARPEFANLPLMMVTTETEMEQMVTALEAGANEYVMKPFGKETLAEKLQLLGLGAA